ncbi:MAG: alpha/beta hydrolase [Defluviimonas denitrificans]
MPHLPITAEGCQWRHAGTAASLDDTLAALPEDQPVVILIHGYRYRPGHPRCDPHRLILSRDAGLGASDISWPHHLGIRDDQGALSIGFGWNGFGTLRQARDEAGRAGLALAALIRRIRILSPGRRISVMAHSLGAKVMLSALPALEPGDIARAVLLFPALLARETVAATTLRAAAGMEVIRVTSRENLLFDLIGAALAAGGWDGPVSPRVTGALPGWSDLPIDCAATLAHLAAGGFPIATRQRRVCHWSSYLRPGIFALYRALLTAPDPLPLAALAPPVPAGAEGWAETPAEFATT